MKLFVVEDDPIAILDLKEKLNILAFSDIHFFSSVIDTKQAVIETRPDMVIVDIDLGTAETGINLGHWLDLHSIPYFFLTGKQDVTTFFETTTTQAKINIEKPISLATLRNVIHETLKKKIAPTKSFVFLNIDGYEMKVFLDDILFLKAARSYCELRQVNHTKPDLISMPMSALLDKLNHLSIHRVHKSYAVNVKHVLKKRGNVLYVGEDLTPIDIGKTYQSDIAKILFIE